MLTSKNRLLAIFLLGPVSISIAGQPSPLPPQFSLSQYIPEDFWFVANVVPTPESDWVRNQWWRVASKLSESGIGSDLVSLFSSSMTWEANKLNKQDPMHWLGLLGNVQWRELLNGEIAIAERMRHGSLDYEYVMLSRTSPVVAGKNMATLVELFKSLSQTQESLHLTHTQQHGIDQWLLRDNHAALYGGGNFKLTLLRKDDIVGLILGTRARKEVLSLIIEKPGARSILQTPRFQQALSQVDAPQDSYTYFDIRMLIDDVRLAADRHMEQERINETTTVAAPIVKAALKLADIYDYTFTSVRTEGMQQHVQAVTRIQPGKRHAPLSRMIYDRPPITRFDRYIPKNAISFSMDSNVNMGRGYHLLRHFVAEHVPDGVGMLSKFDSILSNIGLNIDRDILSWLSGESMCITLPASAPTPMSQYDTVFFVRVKDPEVAYQKVDQALKYATGRLRAVGQPVFVRQVETPCGQCCEVVHPLLAMIGRPVIGVTGDWLYVSNSVDSVNRCLAVSRGEAPSVLQNKRFLREGITPPGQLRSISFTDRRQLGKKLARQAAAVKQFSPLLSSFILQKHLQDPGSNIEDQFIRTELIANAMGVISKLPTVLKEINFFSSEASYCTFDGQYVRSQGLVTYRNPKDDWPDDTKIIQIERLVTP